MELFLRLTRYVKNGQNLKIPAGFSGHSLFALVPEQESGPISHCPPAHLHHPAPPKLVTLESVDESY